MNSAKTLSIIDDRNLTYVEVVSNSKPKTAIVRLIGGKNETTCFPALDIKNWN